jgi:hypothetical protein
VQRLYNGRGRWQMATATALALFWCQGAYLVLSHFYLVLYCYRRATKEPKPDLGNWLVVCCTVLYLHDPPRAGRALLKGHGPRGGIIKTKGRKHGGDWWITCINRRLRRAATLEDRKFEVVMSAIALAAVVASPGHAVAGNSQHFAWGNIKNILNHIF